MAILVVCGVKESGQREVLAIETLEDGLEDSLTYYDFKSLDARKVSSNNMLECLNKETRRRTRVIGLLDLSASGILRLSGVPNTTVSGLCRGKTDLAKVMLRPFTNYLKL